MVAILSVMPKFIQTDGVRSLLFCFLFSFDLPGKTTLTKHDIKLPSTDPIHYKPYALPHALIDTVKSEMGVIEKAEFPYASRIVLVKKEGWVSKILH